MSESDVKSRIPPGAEATSVLVGNVEGLDRQVVAFIRLTQGLLYYCNNASAFIMCAKAVSLLWHCNYLVDKRPHFLLQDEGDPPSYYSQLDYR